MEIGYEEGVERKRGVESYFHRAARGSQNLQSGFIKVFLIPLSLSWHLLSLKHA